MRDSVIRVGRTLFVVLAVAVSLLTFPAGITAMTGCWLAAYTVATIRRRSATLCLITPLAVMLVKRVNWPMAFWIFLVVAIGALILALSRKDRPPWTRFLPHALLWLAWLGFGVDAYLAIHINHRIAPLDHRPIVCIGDSLTSDGRSGGYPEVLAEKVRVPVINLGQPGITSGEALKKLPDLVAARPQVVVIELGGHDFLKDTSWLKRASRASTKHNLQTLIDAARKIDAEVILLEVPRGFVTDPYVGLERQLAREHDFELIPDTVIRRFVLESPVAPPGMWSGGPYLSDDGLHPNQRGNELLAKVVLRALTRICGPAVTDMAEPGIFELVP